MGERERESEWERESGRRKDGGLKRRVKEGGEKWWGVIRRESV